MIVSGKISVKAILKERQRDIKAVYLLDTRNDKESRYVESIAKGIEIKRMTREALDDLANNTSHGGYLVECGPRISNSFKELNLGESVSLLCVEGVTDPFNLGEVCRTIAALGFDGIITPQYDFYEHEAKLIRASAGASESLWWLQSDALERDLLELKNRGVTIATTHRSEDSISLQDYPMPEAICICLGGALRGLSQAVLSLSDVTLKLDYNARVSLSTVGATTVFAYERFRQKGAQ